MNLKYITCSDPREFNDIHDIVKLAKTSPRAEIAIQMHPSKASPGMPRYEWAIELVKKVQHDQYYDYMMGLSTIQDRLNLAIHINNEWAAQICRTGRIPEELHPLLVMRYRGGLDMRPIVRRIQINVPPAAAHDASVIDMAHMMDVNRDYRFIVQYNAKTADLVGRLNQVGAKFSPLYDASGGRGLSPDSWQKPVFDTRMQGYSGGISPENVAENLNKISSVVSADHDVWIDAEGKLKTDDRFDIMRARQYIINAENWLKKQR